MPAPNKESYRIMGIDPGTNYMGYGVVEVTGRELRSVVMGAIDLHKLTDPYAKLRRIFDRVGALKLGRAQGVAMAAALCRDVPVFEYAPSRIKQCITGGGAAAKEQVAALVTRILGIDYTPKKLDETDGMAVALCHYFMSCSPLNAALGDERNKGLGGGRKAASARGSKSWEKFLKENPDRELKR